MENNCSIICEGERPLIHLVRQTTKEQKITQYEVNTHEIVLISNQRSMQMSS